MNNYICLTKLIENIVEYLQEAKDSYLKDFQEASSKLRAIELQIDDLGKKLLNYEVQDEDLGEIRKIKTILAKIRKEADKILSVTEE